MRGAIIVGHGQIGQAVHKLIGEAGVVDIKKEQDIPGLVNTMHVCVPYSEDFVEIVTKYKKKYDPIHMLIWSTVAIGTTKHWPDAVHTPVEGRHPKLSDSLLFHRRWIGYNTLAEGLYFKKYFTGMNLKVHMINNTDHTEALKLLSTSEFGVNLIFADYKKMIADKLKIDYMLMKDWNRDYNELYRYLDMPQFSKYLLDPPNGYIGGHCVRPNAKILDEMFPHDLLKMITEMGEIE